MPQRRLSCPLAAACIGALLAWPCTAREPEARWQQEWPRFRSWEYGLTLGASLGAISARFLIEQPPPNFRGKIFGLDAPDDALAVRGADTRLALGVASDVMLAAALVYRLADSTLVPGLVHDDWDLALQMSLIDLQSHALVSAALFGSQLLIRRERPIVRRCHEPEIAASERSCNPRDEQRNRSFIAGHTAVAFTTAGLTCVHHAHLPLYGSPGDDLACAATLGWAGVVFAARLVTQNHHTSDNLLAAALGLSAGWLLPLLLHYRSDDTETPSPSAPTAGPLGQWFYAGDF